MIKSKRKNTLKNRHLKKKSLTDRHGFTLVEVMVSCLIFLLASQLFVTGVAVARKMEKRANEISAVCDTLEAKLADESACTAGKIRLKLDGEKELAADGWLYRYEHEGDGQPVVEVMRLDSSLRTVTEEETEEEE